MSIFDLWYGNPLRRMETLQTALKNNTPDAISQINALGNRLIKTQHGTTFSTEEASAKQLLEVTSNVSQLRGVDPSLLGRMISLSHQYGLPETTLKLEAHQLALATETDDEYRRVFLSKVGKYDQALTINPGQLSAFYKKHPELIDGVIAHYATSPDKLVNFLNKIEHHELLIYHLSQLIDNTPKTKYMMGLLNAAIRKVGRPKAEQYLQDLKKARLFTAAYTLHQHLVTNPSADLRILYAKEAQKASQHEQVLTLLTPLVQSALNSDHLPVNLDSFLPTFISSLKATSQLDKLSDTQVQLLQHPGLKTASPEHKIHHYQQIIRSFPWDQIATLPLDMWLQPILQSCKATKNDVFPQDLMSKYLDTIPSLAQLPLTTDLIEALSLLDKRDVPTLLQKIAASIIQQGSTKEFFIQLSKELLANKAYSKEIQKLLIQQADLLFASEIKGPTYYLTLVSTLNLLKGFFPNHPHVSKGEYILNAKKDLLQRFITNLQTTLRPLSIEQISHFVLPGLFIYQAEGNIDQASQVLEALLRLPHERAAVTNLLSFLHSGDPSLSPDIFTKEALVSSSGRIFAKEEQLRELEKELESSFNLQLSKEEKKALDQRISSTKENICELEEELKALRTAYDLEFHEYLDLQVAAVPKIQGAEPVDLTVTITLQPLLENPILSSTESPEIFFSDEEVFTPSPTTTPERFFSASEDLFAIDFDVFSLIENQEAVHQAALLALQEAQNALPELKTKINAVASSEIKPVGLQKILVDNTLIDCELELHRIFEAVQISNNNLLYIRKISGQQPTEFDTYYEKELQNLYNEVSQQIENIRAHYKQESQEA